MSGSPKIIAFILPALNAGGAEHVLITLMNNLDRQKYKPILISMAGKGPLLENIEKDIEIYHLNTSVKAGPFKLYQTLKHIQPDIAVSTMVHMNFATLILRSFFPKTRFIIREAITPSYLFNKYGHLSFLIKTLYKLLYPKANIILSPADKIFEELETLLPRQSHKFVTLRNPFELNALKRMENFPPLTAERNKTLHFIACGRLEHQKGFDRLITSLACADLPYDWILDIYGQGGEEKNLTSLIQETKQGHRIYLKGFTSKPYMQLGAADYFLLPSRFEGLPNVALESLACGTPVIATRESGGIDEIVSLSQEGSVTLTDDMRHFIEALIPLKPNPTKNYRPTLLPDIFKQENVLKKFEEILA